MLHSNNNNANGNANNNAANGNANNTANNANMTPGADRKPRGLRNNNPLNIRRTADEWRGMRKKQTDPAFCQFITMAYGWRAALLLLTHTYYRRYRLSTIRAIITRWAPPTENNTEAYIQTVADRLGYDPQMPLGVPADHPDRWMQLALAMAAVENGVSMKHFETQPLLQGWAMARMMG